MPQSLSNVLVHIVFSTKERRAMLRGEDLRAEMHKYLGGISNNLDCPPIIVGGTDDHVHLLCAQARTIALADWIKELKRGSSIWIKTKGQALEWFQWQAGYGAFSVSQSQSDRRSGISPTRRSTTAGCRSRTSSGSCCENMGSNSTSDTFGIEVDGRRE